MKTTEKLREMNFHSIRMVEARQRPFDGRVVELEVPDTGREPASSDEAPAAKKHKIGTVLSVLLLEVFYLPNYARLRRNRIQRLRQLCRRRCRGS